MQTDRLKYRDVQSFKLSHSDLSIVWGGGQGETALHAAAYGGHSAAVMALIADGANVNARSVSLVLSCTALRQKSLESVCIAIAREQFENGWDLFNLV